MTMLTLSPNLRSSLPDLSRPFTVCDENGNIVGRYLPTSFGPPISRAEIERRKQSKTPAYATSEVLARFEKQ